MARFDRDAGAGEWQAFVRTAMRAPLLEREHETALARRWAEGRDQAALDELVTAHSRLVVATASRFRKYGLPLADLIQEGHIGLLQAAARFEPGREVRFATYAGWWVRAAIQEFILRNWSIVRTGTTAAQKTLFFNLRRLQARLAARGAEDRPGRHQAVAQALGVGEGDVAAMEARLAAADSSLDAPRGDNPAEDPPDRLADDGPTPEQRVIEASGERVRRRLLAAALAELGPRERRIVEARCLRDDAATLEELGRGLGISKERVRQLEQRALGRLRQAIRRHVADPADILPAA